MSCLVLTDRGVELTGLHPDGVLQDGDILLELAGEYMPDMIELEWESFSKKLREHQDHNIVAIRYKGHVDVISDDTLDIHLSLLKNARGFHHLLFKNYSFSIVVSLFKVTCAFLLQKQWEEIVIIKHFS